MDEELDYLWETLGLEITADLWPERDKKRQRKKKFQIAEKLSAGYGTHR